MKPPRWLLSLGSNLDTDARVREALDRLQNLGQAEPVTAIRAYPAHHGHGQYFSVLVDLRFHGERAALDAALKRLEAALGRRRDGATSAVAIDIDILARETAAGWQADPHAVAKHEFEHADVVAMLAEAGIAIRHDQ